MKHNRQKHHEVKTSPLPEQELKEKQEGMVVLLRQAIELNNHKGE